MSKEQIQAGLEILIAVGQAVREAGPLGIGSGVLYAAFAAHGFTVDSWNRLLAVLIRQKLVENRNHCLVWIGPEGPAVREEPRKSKPIMTPNKEERAEAYIAAIRTHAKKAYARAYWEFLSNASLSEPNSDTLTVMAAQAVRMNLLEIRGRCPIQGAA